MATLETKLVATKPCIELRFPTMLRKTFRKVRRIKRWARQTTFLPKPEMTEMITI